MKILHMSDLHFGTEDPKTVQSLLDTITKAAPDLIIISGDFTQIGSNKEFAMAQDFLQKLPAPSLCIPGNHDVPAVNILERLFTPYKDYKTYIHPNLCPTLENETAQIAGINSARRALPHWNWANGAVSGKQRQKLADFFKQDSGKWRICTLHHPVHKVHDMPIDVTVFGRKRTLDCFQALKIDLVLTGHVHHASITTLGDETHQTTYISASTALSSRVRGQENGFNLITLGDDHMSIDVFAFKSDNSFQTIQNHTIPKSR